MSKDMNDGTLTETAFYILLSLHAPLHGYGIMQKVRDMTGDRINMGAGTMYGALNLLLERGWIALHAEEARRKEYVITQEGKKVLAEDVKRLEERVAHAKQAMGGDAS